MTNVVFDTNVYISALFWEGIPRKIFVKSLTGELQNHSSPTILQELERKLQEKFHVPKEKTDQFLETIIFSSIIVDPPGALDVVKEDPSDNKILECAVTANASYVVTGDTHMLNLESFLGIQVVTPRQVLELIDER